MDIDKTLAFIKNNLPSVIITSIVVIPSAIMYEDRINDREIKVLLEKEKAKDEQIKKLELDIKDYTLLYEKCLSTPESVTDVSDFDVLFQPQKN